MSKIISTPTLQELAHIRIRQQHDALQLKRTSAQAQDARLRQSHGDVLRIFQRDILRGAKLPANTRIESIIHGHHIAVNYAGGRSIVAEHLFRIEGDSLVVPVFGGLIQIWIANKGNVGGVREKRFEDFLDAFIWLFRGELEARMGQ